MEEENIIQENQAKTKYIVFDTIEKYNALNTAISQALGFPDSKENTEIYATNEPEANERGLFIMPITVFVQVNCEEILKGFELID